MYWYDKAVMQLEEDYANEKLTDEEFDMEMRNLNESLKQEAEENAEQAYHDVMGY